MLSQKLILNYLSKIIIQILQVIATIVIARYAGADVLGSITFALAYTSAFWFIADLGTGTAHMKYISENSDSADIIKTYIVIKLCLIIAYVIIVLTFFMTQKYLFKVDFGATETELLIYMSICIIVLQQLVLIPNSTFAGKAEQAKQDIPSLIQNIFFQISRIIFVLVGMGAFYLVMGHLASVLMGALISFYLFRNYPIGIYRKDIAIKYIRTSLPILTVIVIIILMQNLDKVIIQFSNNSSEVGIYAVGYRFGGFILSFSDTVNLLLFPIFTSAFKRDDYAFVFDIVRKYEKLCLAFGLPLIILIIMLSKDILLLLVGNSFIGSVATMQILLLASFIMLLSIPYYNILNGKSLFKLTSQLYFIGFLIFLLFSFILVGPFVLNFGATGMAICLLLNNLFLFVMFRIKSFGIMKFNNKLFFIPYFILSLFIFSIYLVITNLQYFSHSWDLLVGFVLFFLLLAAFRLFKLFEKEDFIYLNSVLKVNLLTEYIKTELTGSRKRKK